MPAKKSEEIKKNEDLALEKTAKKTTKKSTTEKPATKKAPAKKTTKEAAVKKPAKKKVEKEQETQEVVSVNVEPETEEEELTLQDLYDFCDLTVNAGFYEVDADRELFMELRKIVDNAFAKRNKSKADEEKYDEIIYNLTTKCLDDESLQDFMGYCYKKGKYDFCLLNYEKYMKWTILAASRGNAFSLSKLQLFYQTQIEELLSIKGINKVAELLDVEDERFLYVLMKKLSDALVYILNLIPEEMIKEPEVYVEQNDQIMRKLDKAKAEALTYVKKECEDFILAIENLNEQERQANLANNELYEEEIADEEPDEAELQRRIEEEALKQTTSSNRFVKKAPSKKKFRW